MTKTKSMIYCGLFTALIAAGAFIKIPVPVVPFTLQYLFTMLAGLFLGSRKGMSSWWCMIHGYKHPELTEAIKEQADRFCHVMLGGLTHEPVEKLSAKLQEFLPGDLDYCFFQIQEVLQWRSHLKWPFNTTPIREESAR